MRGGRCGHKPVIAVLAGSSLFWAANAPAAEAEQSETPPSGQSRSSGNDDKKDIVVTGERGSAVSDIAPLATFDANAILATGASSMGELLRAIRGTTQSADGSDPIFLLNAQRVPSYQEIGALPPEALEKIEVLPEPAALKFGFPPTRRVLNFITKRSFKQNELRVSAGTATRGGTTTEKANLALTRLKDSSRLTLGLEYRRTDPLFRSDRNIAPDPDITFDALGNVRGVNGEIDPALSALAGHVVRIAGVPDAAADRTSLTGYAGSADKPRLFDIGPYQMLVARNDAVKAEAVLADKIGATLSGSISLSAEQSRDRSLAGIANASLIVPAGNPYSPFARPVLLDRYLTEAAPLRQNQTTTTLHAGFLLRGAISGWQLDVTGTLDQKLVEGSGERNIDMTRANAAIAAGANPFAPLDAGLLTNRLTDIGHVRTRAASTKTVVNNTPIRIPGGRISVTATVEAERSSAVSSTRGPDPSDLDLGRSRTEAGLAIDIPLTSRREHFLPYIGDLSANASVRLRNVGGFGALHDATYGLGWSPIEGVQLLATVKHSAAAPDMTVLATPVLRIADVPVFDHATGRTVLVTMIRGGNPDLEAEHRLVRSLGFSIKPFAKTELRLSATYEDTIIRNQTGTVYAITPQTEALLPGLFVRDASGRLLSVTYQPINFGIERVRTLNMTLNANGRLGKPKPPAPGSGPLVQPPNYYGGMGPSIKFSDRLQLRPGTPELDLLGGDTVNGGGMSRVYGYVYGGINYNDIGVTFDGWYQRANRVRNADPAGDLNFSPLLRFNFTAYVGARRLLGDRPWAKKLQLRVEVSNLTDSSIKVRDGNGKVPNRYQAIEPVGRTVTLSLRKRF